MINELYLITTQSFMYFYCLYTMFSQDKVNGDFDITRGDVSDSSWVFVQCARDIVKLAFSQNTEHGLQLFNVSVLYLRNCSRLTLLFCAWIQQLHHPFSGWRSYCFSLLCTLMSGWLNIDMHAPHPVNRQERTQCELLSFFLAFSSIK